MTQQLPFGLHMSFECTDQDIASYYPIFGSEAFGEVVGVENLGIGWRAFETVNNFETLTHAIFEVATLLKATLLNPKPSPNANEHKTKVNKAFFIFSPLINYF